MMKVVMADIYDKSGNLEKINVHDLEDNFILQIMWDDQDEQSFTNRKHFRLWAIRQLKQRGYEPQ